MKKCIISALLAIVIVAKPMGFIPINSSISTDELSHKVVKNPSLLAYQPSKSLMMYVDYSNEIKDLENKGLFLTLNNLGFGLNVDKDDVMNYAFSIGDKAFDGIYFGYCLRAYEKELNPESDFSLTFRPTKRISLAGNVKNVFKQNTGDILTDIGLSIRPFKSDWITFSGDINIKNKISDNSLYNISMNTKVFDGTFLELGYLNKIGDKPENARYSINLNFTDAIFKGGYFISKEFSDKNYGDMYGYFQISNKNNTRIRPDENNRLIEIRLKGNYRDYLPKRSFLSNMISEWKGSEEKSINKLINQINHLRSDPEVYGLKIIVDKYTMSYTQKEELRKALSDFKDNDNKIYTYFENADQSDYYLASVSDNLYMHPLGNLGLSGFSTDLILLKGLFDKIGIKYQIIKRGKYKSYTELFSNDSVSNENLTQVKRVLENFDRIVKTEIKGSRNLTDIEVNKIFNEKPYYNAKTAYDNKLIDGIITLDKFNSEIYKNTSKKLKIRNIESYLSMGEENKKWTAISDKKIALIYADGTINDGESSEGNILAGNTMGSTTIIKLLKLARSNIQVKAIVLRINSNGGSVLGSDKILHEIKKTQEQYKKPVIISMGDVAASGAYWMSCFAEKIYADNFTQTGSIGVFSMYPAIDSLATSLGIKTHRVKVNNFAQPSAFNKLNKDEINLLQEEIDYIYESFLDKVAEGREIDKNKLKEIAEGRVWTGEDAKQIGLIDEIGTLNDAIEYAAEIAKVDIEDNYIAVYTEPSKLNISSIFKEVILSKEEQNLLNKIKKNNLLEVISSEENCFVIMPYYFK
ncbi:MAG: signal peptide peptidase SppA [Candidatus Delongbacteria bacterium]|jgi:protease-4|nr:signal peptide peptidase SppA [Candidatus Delongbacteria bacterium]